MWGWQPHHHLWADCLENVGASTSHNHIGLHACYRDTFTFILSLSGLSYFKLLDGLILIMHYRCRNYIKWYWNMIMNGVYWEIFKGYRHILVFKDAVTSFSWWDGGKLPNHKTVMLNYYIIDNHNAICFPRLFISAMQATGLKEAYEITLLSACVSPSIF
jgi:hypothetical protein